MATSIIPEGLLAALSRAAECFYRELDVLEWPDDYPGGDSPAREATIVFHIARQLSMLEKPFHLYLEAAMRRDRRRGRMDLIGYDGDLAIAMEAKCFGVIGTNSLKLAGQVQDMRQFSPFYALRSSEITNKDWWLGANRRIGMVVILSFRRNVAEAWDQQTPELLPKGQRESFRSLLFELKDAQRVVFPISSEEETWKSCGPINLLVAGFEL